MRVERVADPGAIYEASDEAQTFEGVNEFRNSNSDCEDDVTEIVP